MTDSPTGEPPRTAGNDPAPCYLGPLTLSGPTPSPKSGRHVAFVLGVVLFIGAFAQDYTNLRQLSGLIYWFNDLVFYSDTRGTYSNMKDLTFEGDMRKHPLFSVTVHPMVEGVNWISGWDTRQSVRVVLGLLAAANITLFYLVLLAARVRFDSAVFFALLYSVLFANQVFFSLPETYSLSSIGILIFFFLLIRFQDGFTALRAAVLGVAAGTCALLNPPLGLLVVTVFRVSFRSFERRKAIAVSLASGAAAVVIFLGFSVALIGPEFFEFSRKYSGKWASVGNLASPRQWLNVLVSFFLYGVLTPLNELKRSITLADFDGYFRTPIHTLLLTGYLSCLPIVVLYAARIRDGVMEAVGLWLALAVVFYVYFNPGEAFLYSCQVLGPFLVMVARGFESMDWRGRKWLATLFFAGLAWANLRAFFG